MTDNQTTMLPINLAIWLASFTPLLILLVLLVWRRWSTSAAAPIALAAAVLVALLLFETPLRTLAVAAGKGIWDAIFILYVIWPALILYNTANEAGTFDSIQTGIRRFIPDRLLVVLVISWVLSSFIQGVAGFGTPLAVTAPLMVGLGVKPLYAVLLPLLGRAWANTFGSLGASWLAILTVVDLPNQTLTLVYAGILLWIPELTAGLAIAFIYGGWWAIKRGAPAIALISLLQGGVQLVAVPFLPVIGNFLASSAALGGALLISRLALYRQEDEREPNRIFRKTADQENAAEAASETDERPAKNGEPHGEALARVSPPASRERRPSLAVAFAPYAILGVLALIVLLIPPVNAFLARLQIGLPFPETTTGYGLERPATPAYAAFAPFTHPGTLLLFSSFAGYLLFRSRGLYSRAMNPRTILARSAEDALPATTAVVALLLMSKVMDHSGEITVLALGITTVASDVVYLAASPFIGLLGAFITSSNTASNILFAPLQATAAQAEGLPVELAIAAQTAGAATGNAIAPSDILLGATAVGMPQSLGAILARALPWTLVTGAFVSLGTVALHILV